MLRVKSCFALLEYTDFGGKRDLLSAMGKVELESGLSWKYACIIMPDKGYELVVQVLTGADGLHNPAHRWATPVARWTKEQLGDESPSFAPLTLLEAHATHLGADVFSAAMLAHEVSEGVETFVYELLAAADTLLLHSYDTDQFNTVWARAEAEAAALVGTEW